MYEGVRGGGGGDCTFAFFFGGGPCSGGGEKREPLARWNRTTADPYPAAVITSISERDLVSSEHGPHRLEARDAVVPALESVLQDKLSGPQVGP